MRGPAAALLVCLVTACGDGRPFPMEEVALSIDTDSVEVELGKAFPLRVVRSWHEGLIPDPWHDEKAPYRAGFGAGLVRAEELLGRGRIPEAIELLESLRARRPSDVTTLNNLSVAYRQVGRAAEAMEVLESGLASHPDYFPFHLNLATGYHAAGDLDRALEHLDRALEINPRLGRAYEQKGAYLVQAGRLREALEAFDTALTYDARGPRVFLSAGILEAELGNWSRAVERLAALK